MVELIKHSHDQIHEMRSWLHASHALSAARVQDARMVYWMCRDVAEIKEMLAYPLWFPMHRLPQAVAEWSVRPGHSENNQWGQWVDEWVRDKGGTFHPSCKMGLHMWWGAEPATAKRR